MRNMIWFLNCVIGLVCLPSFIQCAEEILDKTYLQQQFLYGQDLQKISTLELNSKNLKYLEAAVFSGLTQVKKVFLYSNQLKNLDEPVFNDTPYVTEIYLNNNQIFNLNRFLFQNTKSLSILNLKSNQLYQLDSRLFDGLSELKELDLSSNRLSNLTVGVFKDLKNLIKLNLYENQLYSLGISLFNGLASLERLILRKNQLTKVPPNIFNDLLKLNILDLSHNQLIHLDSYLFKSLIKLQMLYLNNNKLVNLNISLLVNELKYLYINENNLTVVGRQFLDEFNSLCIYEFKHLNNTCMFNAFIQRIQNQSCERIYSIACQSRIHEMSVPSETTAPPSPFKEEINTFYILIFVAILIANILVIAIIFQFRKRIFPVKTSSSTTHATFSYQKEADLKIATKDLSTKSSPPAERRQENIYETLN